MKIGPHLIALNRLNDNEYFVCWEIEKDPSHCWTWNFNHSSAEAVSVYWFRQLTSIAKYKLSNPEKPWPYIAGSTEINKIIHMCKAAVNTCLNK